MANEVNVSDRLRVHSSERPNQPAIIVPDGQGWTSITYKALDISVDQYARGFQEKGIERGDRVLFLLKPGIEFYGALLGLFRLGATPVLLDPGMGIPAVLACIGQIKPKATVAIPLVHLIRLFKRKPFATSKINVTAGARWLWGGHTLAQCKSGDPAPFELAPERSASDEGLIAFTSGSTGTPKGVSFLHSMFIAQADLLGEVFQWTPDRTTVQCFAAFVVFDLARGMTVVIPDINLSKPATADPANVVKAIVDHGAHTAFASPVIWANVTRWCQANNTKLDSLERVLTAGAPIPADMHRRFNEILTDGAQLFTPYGATEALPVATLGSTEVLGETWERTSQGWGTCVGTLFPQVNVKIIGISDDAIATWSDDLALDDGVVGEIVVDAPVVSPEYKDRPEANAISKISHDGRIMHRMGDIGYFDDKGRLWFCGRKTHALWTPPGKYTASGVLDTGMIPAVPLEGLFNEHAKVLRTALVGVGPSGSQVPVLCVQLEQGETWSDTIATELTAMAQGTRWEGVVQRVLHNADFPTDARHNSKIKRGELRTWADGQCADLIKEST